MSVSLSTRAIPVGALAPSLRGRSAAVKPCQIGQGGGAPGPSVWRLGVGPIIPICKTFPDYRHPSAAQHHN